MLCTLFHAVLPSICPPKTMRSKSSKSPAKSPLNLDNARWLASSQKDAGRHRTSSHSASYVPPAPLNLTVIHTPSTGVNANCQREQAAPPPAASALAPTPTPPPSIHASVPISRRMRAAPLLAGLFPEVFRCFSGRLRDPHGVAFRTLPSRSIARNLSVLPGFWSFRDTMFFGAQWAPSPRCACHPSLGPLGCECSQHRRTPRPSVERIRGKFLLSGDMCAPHKLSGTRQPLHQEPLH